MNDLFAIPVLAMLVSLVLTPVVRRLAEALGIVDRPDAHRKMHERAIPLCGGVAVFLAAVAAVSAASMLPNAWAEDLRHDNVGMLGLVGAAAVLVIVGVVDDWRNLRGRQKLVGQIVAVAILLSSGFPVEGIRLFGWHVDLGDLWWLFTGLWLLVAINSVNLIDGVDGLAATVGIILCSTLAIMAFMKGYTVESLIALSMVGALVGFLYFNFPPATIFLGDAGSMLIGLTAGALAIRCSLKGAASVALAAPIAIWAIPFFDTGVAVLRRKLTGRSIYTTDRGHLHHCMLRRSESSWQAVSWIAALCLITSAGALATVYFNNEAFALASVAIVIVALIASGIFGHAEFLLLANHLRSASVQFLNPVRSADLSQSVSRVRLQGSRNWDEIFERLRESAELIGLSSVRLDVNLPALHEGYHASWQRSDTEPTDYFWRTVVPLLVRGRPVGRLEFVGERQPAMSIDAWLKPISELLEASESRVLELVQGRPAMDDPSRLHLADGPHPPGSRAGHVGRIWPLDAEAQA